MPTNNERSLCEQILERAQILERIERLILDDEQISAYVHEIALKDRDPSKELDEDTSYWSAYTRAMIELLGATRAQMEEIASA